MNETNVWPKAMKERTNKEKRKQAKWEKERNNENEQGQEN